ncbi:MAG: WD40 repeat domain-containing protein [Anaerolineae bacterium]
MKSILLLVFISFLLMYPVTAQDDTNCSSESGLMVLGSGYVTAGPLNVRDTPSPAGVRITQLDVEAVVRILDGPVCSEAFIWWQIQTDSRLSGWVVEGTQDRRWLIPIGTAPESTDYAPLPVPDYVPNQLLFSGLERIEADGNVRFATRPFIYDAETGELIAFESDLTTLIHPNWTSEGNTIIASTVGMDGVVVINAETGTEQFIETRAPLTNGSAQHLLSSNNRWIAYANNRVFVMDIESGEERILLERESDTRYSVQGWSPDGNTLAVISTQASRDRRLILINIEDGTTQVIETIAPYNATFSPDGSRLAMTVEVDRGEAPAPADLIIYDIDQNAELARYTAQYGYMPAWSPDGQQVIFRDADEILIANADGTGISRRWSFPGQGAITYFAWSPDDRRVAYTVDLSRMSAEDNQRIFLINLAQDIIFEIPDIPPLSNPYPAWRPTSEAQRITP